MEDDVSPQQAPMERGQDEHDFEHDVTDVITAEAGNLFSKHARVLVYLNSTLLVSLVFFTGIYYQRFNDLERRVDRMASFDVVTNRLEELSRKVDRLQALLDRKFYGSKAEREDEQ